MWTSNLTVNQVPNGVGGSTPPLPTTNPNRRINMPQKLYSASVIQELLRVAYCLSQQDFREFMVSTGGNPHMCYIDEKWNQFKDSPLDFIFTLDGRNIVIFFDFLNAQYGNQVSDH